MNPRSPSPVVLFAALLLALTARAQTFTGAISGRVLDSQQTALPNASVTLQSPELGFERHTIANAQGEYTLELIPPGRPAGRLRGIRTDDRIRRGCNRDFLASRRDATDSSSPTGSEGIG